MTNKITDYGLGKDSILYHYTSPTALKNIIENKTLWFSDYRFVNDIDELQYGLDLTRECVDELIKNEKDASKINLLHDWYLEIDNFNHDRLNFLGVVGTDKEGNPLVNQFYSDKNDIFIFSLTRLNDDKDMWHMYSDCDCGYRLKINMNELLNYCYEIRDNFYLDKGFVIDNFFLASIIYDKKYAKQIINHLINEDIVNNHAICLKQPGLFASRLPMFKREDFKNENEYRLIFVMLDEMFRSDTSGKIKKTFIIKNGVFTPYLQLNSVPFDKIIEEIMISPYNTSDLVEKGLKELLFVNNLENIKITHSKIRIR